MDKVLFDSEYYISDEDGYYNWSVRTFNSGMSTIQFYQGLTAYGISGQDTLGEAWTKGKALGRASLPGGSNAQTTRVGRWMSQAEYDTMVKTGKVPESFSGTTHVANPADPKAFGKQAKPGSI